MSLWSMSACRLAQCTSRSILRTSLRSSSAGSALYQQPPGNKVESSFFNLLQRYEDAIGLTAVKQAQEKVIAAENMFSSCQEKRREKQEEIKRIQYRLKEIHSDLDKTSRGEDRYLQLLTEEHKIIKEERHLLDDFQGYENEERNSFHRLSACLRESHEKERERGERTKYWSIFGSLIGAILGIMGTTINNRMRMRELRDIVEDASDPARVKLLLTELSTLVHTQQQHVGQFIGDIKGIIAPDSPKTNLASIQLNKDLLAQDDKQTAQILKAIKDQDAKIDKELDQLKRLIAVEHGHASEEAGGPSVVYVGPDMETLLDQTERNLESKMKLQTVMNVVLVYAALAVTVPVLYAIFRGG
uniref:Coiled-coil domain-containing protein 51 n=1 Tax=Plectus sambesii TaxID=2011161 RepID=A0A914WSS1_9BILA